MENGYPLLCFENGARPDAEVFDACRCYSYEDFVAGIVQGVVARQLSDVLEEYSSEAQLLVFDIQKADGRPETMKIINSILRARCKRHNPTFLIGEYIPESVFSGIRAECVFITAVAPDDRTAAKGKDVCTNGL